jgi:hypothetical protein
MYYQEGLRVLANQLPMKFKPDYEYLVAVMFMMIIMYLLYLAIP